MRTGAAWAIAGAEMKQFARMRRAPLMRDAGNFPVNVPLATVVNWRLLLVPSPPSPPSPVKGEGAGGVKEERNRGVDAFEFDIS